MWGFKVNIHKKRGEVKLFELTLSPLRLHAAPTLLGPFEKLAIQ